EQGGLPAAGRAAQKQAFASGQLEIGDIQQLRLAWPGKAELVDDKQGIGHGYRDNRVQKRRMGLRAFRVRPFCPCGPMSCTSRARRSGYWRNRPCRLTDCRACGREPVDW